MDSAATDGGPGRVLSFCHDRWESQRAIAGGVRTQVLWRNASVVSGMGREGDFHQWLLAFAPRHPIIGASFWGAKLAAERKGSFGQLGRFRAHSCVLEMPNASAFAGGKQRCLPYSTGSALADRNIHPILPDSGCPLYLLYTTLLTHARQHRYSSCNLRSGISILTSYMVAQRLLMSMTKTWLIRTSCCRQLARTCGRRAAVTRLRRAASQPVRIPLPDGGPAYDQAGRWTPWWRRHSRRRRRGARTSWST